MKQFLLPITNSLLNMNKTTIIKTEAGHLGVATYAPTI